MNQEEQNVIAEMLFPSSQVHPISYWEEKFPKRNLPAGTHVLRIAPSPTGFIHIGALYLALVNKRIAHDTEGVFILRIEDTDTEREIQGARDLIYEGLLRFGIEFDEGYSPQQTKQKGEYGPYLQTQRVSIYHSFVKELIQKGHAYPCFASKDELQALREKQEEKKIRPGYYGEFSLWRNKSFEESMSMIQASVPYTIRFRSSGDQNNKRPYHDELLGDMDIPQNDEDFVLLKTDGIPTYHMAHIVDDYLMKVTFVIRANEWIPSIGKHLELWDAFGLIPPLYGHITPINKQEGNTIRKISKRKDPEANIMHYIAMGYPTDALVGYLYRLANPSFDDWWQSEQRDSVWDFPFSLQEFKQGGRGPLIDMQKLNSISSDLISYFSVDEALSQYRTWVDEYDKEYAVYVRNNLNYVKAMFSIERGGVQNRKDIAHWSQVKDLFSYFFDELFDIKQATAVLESNNMFEIYQKIKGDLYKALLDDALYTGEDLALWVSHMKKIAQDLNFTLDKKKLQESENQLLGDFGSFMKIIRLALCAREHTPNLFFVFSTMGKERVTNRIQIV